MVAENVRVPGLSLIFIYLTLYLNTLTMTSGGDDLNYDSFKSVTLSERFDQVSAIAILRAAFF